MPKQALRFLHNNSNNSHEELLKKSGKNTVNVSIYRSLCIELSVTVILVS